MSGGGRDSGRTWRSPERGFAHRHELSDVEWAGLAPRPQTRVAVGCCVNDEPRFGEALPE